MGIESPPPPIIHERSSHSEKQNNHIYLSSKTKTELCTHTVQCECVYTDVNQE